MKLASLLFSILLLCASPTFAATYTVDTARSSIAFSGTHAGKAFSGKFETWQAEISFDPTDLAASKIKATIDAASAKTGDAMYDGTLPSEDWFNVKPYPQASFETTEIIGNTDGSFTAKGNLTLRGVTKEVSFTFVLTPADFSNPEMTAKATIPINRLDYQIGIRSDASAEWVGSEIVITLHITAKRG